MTTKVYIRGANYCQIAIIVNSDGMDFHLEKLGGKISKRAAAANPRALVIIASSHGSPYPFTTGAQLWAWFRTKTPKGVWWDSMDLIREHLLKFGIVAPDVRQGRSKRTQNGKPVEDMKPVEYHIVHGRGTVSPDSHEGFKAPIIRKVDPKLVGVDPNDEVSKWLAKQGLSPSGS